MTLFSLKYEMNPKVHNMGVTLFVLRYKQNPKVLNLSEYECDAVRPIVRIRPKVHNRPKVQLEA